MHHIEVNNLILNMLVRTDLRYKKDVSFIVKNKSLATHFHVARLSMSRIKR